MHALTFREPGTPPGTVFCLRCKRAMTLRELVDQPCEEVPDAPVRMP